MRDKKTPTTVNILTLQSPGLLLDLRYLAVVLTEAGFRVRPIILRRRNAYGFLLRSKDRFDQVLLGKPAADINIFIEVLSPAWYRHARVNCFIPNQEQFMPAKIPQLAGVDLVLCKTRYAQGIFAGLGQRTEYISFSGPDRRDQSWTKDYRQFFHLAGRSVWKGTTSVIEAWLRHPEWPSVTIVRHKPHPEPLMAGNISYIERPVGDARLREYQNTCGVHVLPSVAEGFGHNIREAMTAEALTLTTNGPPMNELITEDRGVLVEYNRVAPKGLGEGYYIDRENLERKIDAILGMPEEELRCRGARAREWALANDHFFRKRASEVLRGL